MSESTTHAGVRFLDAKSVSLTPWPIPEADITAGRPEAAGHLLWQSDDKRLANGVWSCSVGSFDSEYTWDETFYLLEGEVTITDHGSGNRHTYRGGDLVFVPAGTPSTWDVTEPVRKVFHLRSSTPVEL